MTMQVSGTSGFTFPDNTTQATAAKVGMTNRIINGAMVIDQRNAGASHSLATGGLRYGVDRFFTYTAGANVTGQQVAGTNIGTSKAYRITGATGTTLVNFAQRIEAVNIQDTASQTVTASVKIYCSASITGATVYLLNPTASDNYSGNTTAFSTAITLNSGLNTITVSGVNGANGVYGAEIGIGFTSGIGNGVTVDIGAFQLEKGSTATSFDYRPYGTELALCQRYYSTIGCDQQGYSPSGYAVIFSMTTPQPMRANATVTYSTVSTTNFSSISFNQDYPSCVRGVLGSNAGNTSVRWLGNILLSAEL